MNDSILGILLIFFGIVCVAFPKIIYHTNEGWKHKNTEASETYIGLTVVGGVLAIIFGIFFLL